MRPTVISGHFSHRPFTSRDLFPAPAQRLQGVVQFSLVAAAVGFGGVAGVAMEAARVLFWVFIVLFVISLIAGLARRA
jgi:uncharacterized membrane protein YtjA (UPF0391 family)